ncbi:MAG: hypothetical protein M1825_006305 [Sarcosagium campestre]|nr:MAG: hypothetical protein M1825_006305 [Sarcosagium campestre]
MATRTICTVIFAALLILGTAAFLRLLYILPIINPTAPLHRRRGTPTRLLVVLGSGGHTAEMLALLRQLDPKLYTHRSYLISEGDAFSAQRAREFEISLLSPSGLCRVESQPEAGVQENYDITTVPRARRIHQSLATAPYSAMRCLLACFGVLRGDGPLGYPDLILSNGPGISVCVVLASFALRFIAARGTTGRLRNIYVESWARVDSLSLSGSIVVRLVDRFLVQWPHLQGVGGRGEYLGVLV